MRSLLYPERHGPAERFSARCRCWKLPPGRSLRRLLSSGVIDRVPQTIILVPGPWKTPAEVLAALADGDVEATLWDDASVTAGAVRVDVVTAEGFGPALSVGRAGPLAPEFLAAADACTSAALVQFGATVDADPKRLAAVGRALQAAGGVAVRNEQSGGASAWPPWLEQLESGESYDLIANSIVVVGGEDSVFTCGMHNFDLPDAQIALSDTDAAMDWLDGLCMYQLDESPTLGGGHTFAPDAEKTRRVLERWPDHRHAPHDGRHNPYGLWRLLPSNRDSLAALDPVPTIMPSLVAMLAATEAKRETPLTAPEVETLLDGCPAIAMALADAVKLERSRGYADLEPRRAWAQWELIRHQHRA